MGNNGAQDGPDAQSAAGQICRSPMVCLAPQAVFVGFSLRMIQDSVGTFGVPSYTRVPKTYLRGATSALRAK